MISVCFVRVSYSQHWAQPYNRRALSKWTGENSGSITFALCYKLHECDEALRVYSTLSTARLAIFLFAKSWKMLNFGQHTVLITFAFYTSNQSGEGAGQIPQRPTVTSYIYKCWTMTTVEEKWILLVSEYSWLYQMISPDYTISIWELMFACFDTEYVRKYSSWLLFTWWTHGKSSVPPECLSRKRHDSKAFSRKQRNPLHWESITSPYQWVTV